MSTYFEKAFNLLSPGRTETATPTPADEAEQQNATVARRQVSVPLYVAGAVAQIAGLAAVSYQIAEPGFAYFTILLTLIGMAVSFYLRLIGTPPRLIRSGTLLLGLIFLYALRGAGFFGAIVPPEAQGSQEMLLVSALAFTASFWSFILLTDEAVVFNCVWAIAMIGLTGTVNINRELIICFIVFLAAAAFLLIHQNSLAYGSGASRTLTGGLTLPRVSWPLMRTQLVMAGVAWATSLGLGFLIAVPVQMVGRNMSLATIIQRLKVPAAAAARLPGSPRLVFDNLTQFNIGIGPVADDPTERAVVFSEKPFYWRGRVFDEYTTQGWNSRVTPQMLPLLPKETKGDGLNLFEIPANKEMPRARTKTYSAHFYVNSGSMAPLFHAVEPKRVRGSMSTIYLRPDNIMGTNRGGSADYEVESEVSEAKMGDLRVSSTRYDEQIRNLYLNQGRDSDALQSLAEEALKNIPNNPFDRASAIRRFVAQRCVYTKEARAVPKDRDAAEFFLNESREGYCDLYASAVVVLCRHAGIPARVATGFAPGTEVPREEMNADERRDGRKKYRLTGNDQHAWAEVYFTGYGWFPFDATQDTGGAVTPQTTPKPAPKKSLVERFLSGNKVPLALTALGVLGLLYVAFNELWVRFFSGRQRRATGGRTSGVRHSLHSSAVIQLYLTAQRRLARRTGGPRPPEMTTGEYAAQVRTTLGETVHTPLRALTGLAERALYSAESVTEAEVRQAKISLRDLTTALKQSKSAARQKQDRSNAPIATQ